VVETRLQPADPLHGSVELERIERSTRGNGTQAELRLAFLSSDRPGDAVTRMEQR